MPRTTSHSQQKFSMNWLGSSTASHSTPLMPETARSVTPVSMWCRPCPNSWKRVMTLSCVKVAGWPACGEAKLHTRCATGVCFAAPGGPLPAGSCAVHPGAGALAGACMQVEVELGDEHGCAVGRLRSVRGPLDAVEAHAVVPQRRLVFADRHAEERFDDAEQALQHAWQREVRLHVLLAVGKALLAQALGGEGDVPGLKILKAQFGQSKACGVRPGHARPGAGHGAPGRARRP